MSLFLILLNGLALANTLTYTTSSERLRRDINKLGNRNVSLATEINFSPEKFKESNFLFKNGNKHNTERKLGFLRRRDVSHLDLAYLPPASTGIMFNVAPLKDESLSVSLPTSPSKEILLPFIKESDSYTGTEKNINDVTETGSETKPAQPLNEYLPPKSKMTEVTAKLPQSSFNEYLTSIKMSEEFLENPLETSLKTSEDITNGAKDNEQLVSEISSEEVIVTPVDDQDTAILDEDGYHYKIPNNIPELYLRITPATGYLPPKEGLPLNVLPK